MIFTFFLAAPPSVIHRMTKSQVIITGEVTNLTCQGESQSPPIVTWLKNGQKITNSSRVTLFSSTYEDRLVTSELVITDTKYEDSGEYTCVIGNIVGGTNTSGIVSVHGELVNHNASLKY